MSETSGPGRRGFLQTLAMRAGAGLALPGEAASQAAHAHAASAPAEAPPARAFLDPHQLETLLSLAEAIVPGSTAAGVAPFACVPPGISGSADIPMTAPVTQGTYTLNTESQMQYTCADAINAYGGSGRSIGEILVWGNANIFNVWSPGTYDGNLGGRAGADAICVATKNPAFANTNVHALISISSTDSIANMPATFGFSSGIPLIANYLIAKNWSDLLDGSINTSFAQNGVGTPWWSGTENASDIAIPATSNCLGFTSNAGTDSGNAGNPNTTGTGWANTGNQ